MKRHVFLSPGILLLLLCIAFTAQASSVPTTIVGTDATDDVLHAFYVNNVYTEEIVSTMGSLDIVHLLVGSTDTSLLAGIEFKEQPTVNVTTLYFLTVYFSASNEQRETIDGRLDAVYGSQNFDNVTLLTLSYTLPNGDEGDLIPIDARTYTSGNVVFWSVNLTGYQELIEAITHSLTVTDLDAQAFRYTAIGNLMDYYMDEYQEVNTNQETNENTGEGVNSINDVISSALPLSITPMVVAISAAIYVKKRK